MRRKKKSARSESIRNLNVNNKKKLGIIQEGGWNPGIISVKI